MNFYNNLYYNHLQKKSPIRGCIGCKVEALVNQEAKAKALLLICIMFFLLSVRMLLEKRVSPDATNEDGLTALHQVSLICCSSHMLVFTY